MQTATLTRTPARTRTCLLVGGHRLHGDALRTALNRSGVRLVPVASAREALDAIEGAEAALIDTDLLSDDEALEVLTALLARRPDLHVAGVADTASPALPAAFIRAGASGFLSKQTPLREFALELSRVLDGYLVVDASLARPLFGFLDGDVADQASGRSGTPHLTGVERRVLSLAAEGLINKQIAREIKLSPLTVKNHLARIRARLDAATTAHAVAIALRHGLLG